MKSKVVWLLAGLLGGLVLFLGGMLATATGLSLLIKGADRLSEGSITTESVSGSLLGGLEIDGFTYAAAEQRVTLARLSLSLRPRQLVRGRLVIASLDASGLSVELEEGQGEPVTLPDISLPLPLVVEKARVENSSIRSGSAAAGTDIRSITLSAATMEQNRLTVGQLAVTTGVFLVKAGGELQTAGAYPLDLNFAYTVDIESYAPISGQGTVDGTMASLILDTRLSAPYDAVIAGRINNLLEQPLWSLRLESPKTELKAMHLSWPQLELTDLSITGSGTMESYTLDGSSKGVYGTDTAVMELAVKIDGDGGGLDFSELQLTRGGARCRGKGALNWQDGFAWQAELDTVDLDPALLAAEWPGRLQARVLTSGRMADQGPSVALQIEDLSGELRGYPVAGQGSLRLEGAQVAIEDLELRSGSSVLSVRGEWQERLDLEFSFHSSSLAEVWPGAGGSLHLGGHVQGHPGAPVVNCNLSGQDLFYRDYAVSRLSGKAHGLLAAGDITVSLEGEQVDTGGFEVEQANLSLAGSRRKHLLDIALADPVGKVELRLAGALNDMAWQGDLDRAEVQSAKYGFWSLQKEAALSLSGKTVQIDTLCLSGKDGGRLCVMGQWRQHEGWMVEGEGSALDFPTLEKIAGRQLPLDGSLQASVSLLGNGSDLVSGNLEIDASAASIRKELPPPLKGRFAWKSNRFSLSLLDSGLTGRVEVLLPGDSFVRATAAMDKIGPLDATLLETELAGQVEVQLSTLEDLTPLVGRYVLPSGSLQGTLRLQGTPSAPRVAGSVALSQGKAVLPGLGITLDPLKLTVDGDYQNLTLDVAGSSGQGSLLASAVWDLSRGVDQPVVISITGDHFKAVDLPEYRFILSPDLQFLATMNKGELKGVLTVDEARIAPQNGNGSLKPSRDVMVIDEEVGQGRDAWPFTSDLTIRAGEAVQVDAFGLSGRITGSLQVTDQPSRLQTGNGTLHIEDGAFTIYGKKLRIGVGRLYFTGGPLDDPGIEVRAENQEEGVTTGVEVAGFLRDPEITFYSDPYMEQHEILSRLLTSTSIGGSTREDTGTIGAMAEKIGLGELASVMQSSKELLNIDDIKVETRDAFSDISLIIGSWLTPRFYVSYGRNLLKESSSFNTRYTLGKGFYLKTETGSNQSGGDINYEFER